MAVEKKNRQEKQDSWVNDPTYSISYQIPVLLKVGRAVVLFLLCFLLWMVLAKELHILAIIVGAVFSSIATLYSYSIFFEKSVYYRSDLIIRLEFFILYAFLLVVQSYLASFELIYRIIKGNYRPGVVRIKVRLRSQIGRTFLANTISMIPGTLSLWLEGSHIYVHWFDQKTDHSIKAGIMIKQNFEQIIQRIFG